MAEWDELRALEPIFHRSPRGSDRAVFEALTDSAYWEVGASGRVYDRSLVLDTLTRRYAEQQDEPELVVDDFAARRLAEEVWLVTYELRQGKRVSRRATLWERREAGWCALYHQGTMA